MMCHKVVRKVAQEAAKELYEKVMSANDVRAEWKRQNEGLSEHALMTRFVAKFWPTCIPVARATLAQSLTRGLDSALADDIMEVLVLDQALREGPLSSGRVVGAVTEKK